MNASTNTRNKPFSIISWKKYAAWLPLTVFLIVVSLQAIYRSAATENTGLQSTVELDLDCAAYCQEFLKCVLQYQPALQSMRQTDQWHKAHSACQAGCQKQSALVAACKADVMQGNCEQARSCIQVSMTGAVQ